MKKLSIGFGLLFLTGISVFALWHDSPVTPTHEVGLQALAHRYLEAFCHNPRELAAVISENTALSPSLVSRSTDYLEDLIAEEGSCYGHSKRKLKNELLGMIYDVADDLTRYDLATNIGVRDFFDCLVEIENTFIDLSDSSRRIMDCTEMLDIRGFWYHLLVHREPVTPPPPFPYPYPHPIDITSPVGPITADTFCMDQCLFNCSEPQLVPVPVPVEGN